MHLLFPDWQDLRCPQPNHLMLFVSTGRKQIPVSLMLCQFFQPLLAVTSKSFLANQTLPSYSSLCYRGKDEMVFSIQRHRGSSKGISRILKTFHYNIWGISSFVRLDHLSPCDPVVYVLQASRTLLLCEQTVLEDAPAQEMNPGFSYTSYSMIS